MAVLEALARVVGFISRRQIWQSTCPTSHPILHLGAQGALEVVGAMETTEVEEVLAITAQAPPEVVLWKMAETAARVALAGSV
jgi:hypothetical protein